MATQTKYPDANTLLAEYNKSGNLSIEQMLGGTQAQPEISSENLDSTQKPIVVPPPIPETAGAKYDMTTAGVFTEPEKTDRQEQIGENNTRMMEILGQLSGQPKEALKVQEKAGLFDARKQLGELNKEKKLLDAAYFENVKAIEKNTEGKFGGAVQQDLRNLEREYRDNDYKLAVRTSVANENISTALAISEAYINAKYEPLKIELQGLKDFAEISSNDLSESESLQLQAHITEKQKRLDAEIEKDKSTEEVKVNLLSLAAAGGATSAEMTAITNAKTKEEAVSLSGKFLAAQNNEIIDINGKKALVNKITGKVVSYFGGGKGVSPGTPSVSALADVGELVGGFSSVNAQKMFLSNIEQLAAAGNEQGLAEKIIGQALENIGDIDTKKRAKGGLAISQQLGRLQTLLNDYTARNGDTGLLSGSFQKVQQKLGQVGDPELANIGVQILNTLDNLVRARTGAALTVEEEAFYRKILPDVDKVGALNDALINGLKDSLIKDVEDTLSFAITSSGLAVVKSALPEVFSNSSATDAYLDSALGSSTGNDALDEYLSEFGAYPTR